MTIFDIHAQCAALLIRRVRSKMPRAAWMILNIALPAVKARFLLSMLLRPFAFLTLALLSSKAVALCFLFCCLAELP